MAADAARPLDVEKQLAAAGGIARVFARVPGIRLAIDGATASRGLGADRPPSAGSRRRPKGSPQGRRRVVDGLLAAVHHAPHLKEAVELAVIAASFHSHAGRAQAGGIGLPFVAKRVELGRDHECRRQTAQVGPQGRGQRVRTVVWPSRGTDSRTSAWPVRTGRSLRRNARYDGVSNAWFVTG